MLNSRLSVQANRLVRSTPTPGRSNVQRTMGKANIQANGLDVGFGPPMAGGAPMSTMGIGGPAFNTMFMGILPEYNENLLLSYYRDCYYYDSVGGATVDIISSFPFSEWTLAGIENDMISKYSESLARLNMRSLLQEISNAYLVDSAFIGSLVYDPKSKIFQDILIHDFANASVTPQPFYSIDPVISVNSTNALNQFLNAGSPFVNETLANYPKALINTFLGGSTVLDPLTTLYLPRKGMQDRTSASYLKRLLPVYMLEKILFRGTLTEAQKRLRSTSHIQVGDETWEPNNAEMASILGDFQRSELDPLGAWIVTRQGVQVNEVRPGGDFWKWTDNIDTLTPFKLRALGISEAFLSGDASYACLAGDTLIPTTEGLLRIDSLGTGKDRKKIVKINTVMDSRYGKQKASSWQYNGFQETLKVTTCNGNSIQATGNHPLLVFDGEKTVWKRTDAIQIGDTLCLSKNKVVRTKPLKLNVPLPKERERLLTSGVNRSGNSIGMTPVPQNEFKPGEMPIVPTHMTPKLAYWLALLISEGYTIGKDRVTTAERSTCRIGFKNTDRKLVKRFKSLAEELFGIEVKGGERALLPAEINERGRNGSFVATKPSWEAYILNRRLIDWLEAIGVYMTPGRVDGKTPSYFKSVPWSVLQADEESQVAFLAAYAECDGCVGNRSAWISVSENIRSQITAMLNSHGFQPTRHGEHSCQFVVLDNEQSKEFWEKGSKYLTSKAYTGDPKYSKLDGVPAKHWKEVFKSRKRGFNRHGQFLECDDGTVIQVSISGDKLLDGLAFGDLKRFNYDRYQSGAYDGFLQLLKQISPRDFASLKAALDTPYRFTIVKRIESAGKEHVYDISMPTGKEPAFVANGLVVHNTAEAAVSVFLENMEAYRKFLTYKLFTSKIFPLIAVLNGMYKDPSKAREVRNSGDLQYNLNNQNNLYIPEVHWHKSLEGKDSDSDFDMLEKLSEKGFSIPLKMWASAAGVDINMMLRDLKEDQEIKEKIEKVTGIKAERQGQTDEDMAEDVDGDMRFSAMHPGNMGSRPASVAAARRSVPLLARDFDPVSARMNKSGSGLHAVNETKHSKRVNELIIKASRALQDPNHRASMRKKVQEKLGAGSNLNLIG